MNSLFCSLLVFRLVGVAEDHFVDVGLGELLRLDLVFLRLAPEQVVEERHVELEHFDELDDAAVGDVEFAVEVEGPRVAVGAVLGDLAVVDVAGQLGGVLVLLVLGLERADADAVLLARGSGGRPGRPRRPCVQSPSYLCQPLVEHLAAERAEVALDARRGSRRLAALVELRRATVGAVLVRDQVQRLLVHRALRRSSSPSGPLPARR